MPPKMTKSNLIGKLGAQLAKAHEAHKADETVITGGGDLPAGIENGIAKLVECKFDVYKNGDSKGQYFFYAAGVVVAPRDHDGVPIEGLRTSIMEPLCDTPTRTRKTIDQHLEWIYNELRKLGVDTSSFGYDELEGVCQALKEDGPHFRFRTWKGQKQTTGAYANQEPRTNHQWGGKVEFADDGDAASGVNDQTAAPQTMPDKPSDVDPEDLDQSDLDSLAKRADKGDEKAALLLSEMAQQHGVTEEEINATSSWAEVADLARAADQGTSEDESHESEEEEEFKPEVGDVYKYAPIDPKTKKAGKLVEVEVKAVNEGAKTVDLENVTNRKLKYMKVMFEKLESADD